MKSPALHVSAILFFTMASSAWSQDVNYYLAYGDAAFASKNGSAIGDELRGISDPYRLNSIKVRLMVKRRGGTIDTYGAGGVMFALDWALKNASSYANREAYAAAQTHKVIVGESVVWGKNLPGKTNSGELTTVDVAPLGSLAYSGSAGSGTTERPIGLWQAFGFGTGLNLHLELNKPVMLAEFTLSIDHSKLGFFDTWGTSANETGLMIFGAAQAANRFTYLGATSGTAALRAQKKYALGIPEPASLLTLGGALVAFARRRKN